MLSDRQIREHIEGNGIEVQNVNLSRQLTPSGIDLTLGPSYKRPATQEVFHADNNGGQLILKPSTFYHLHTVEKIRLPDDVHASTEEIMSTALNGVRVTTGVVNPGFEGKLLLGVENISETSKILNPGDKIVQINFYELDEPAQEAYDGDSKVDENNLDEN